MHQGEEVFHQVLVEWQEGGREGATWEDRLTIQDQYLEFNLGDQVVKGVEGNDRRLSRAFKMGDNPRANLAHHGV